MRYVIAVYVENKYGVVSRISGLFMRKGFNIDTFTGGETDNPDFSRITIALDGDEYVRDQIINQLKKLHNVKQVKLLPPSSVEREIMLIKVMIFCSHTIRPVILAATRLPASVSTKRMRSLKLS